ncbi:MAG: hypothetical protein EBV30_10720, partial [Actinobacteria bacterium]|nr:hypothetical protein [Actinomycetota bacterium]
PISKTVFDMESLEDSTAFGASGSVVYNCVNEPKTRRKRLTSSSDCGSAGLATANVALIPANNVRAITMATFLMTSVVVDN